MSQSIYTSHYTYIIKNKTNQMQYIGVRSCNCLPENDSGYMGSSKILGEAMKVEPETFTKIIIDTFPASEIANSNEQWLHETYDVARNPLFYNQMNAPLGFYTGGKTGKDSHWYGKHHSLETKKKLSENHVGMRGRKHTPEARKKISESLKGKILSEETRNKMSAAAKGRTLTSEHKKKISESLKVKTILIMGKTLSPAHKKKLIGPRGPQKKIQCPHCSKIGGGNVMKRWHFKNCREIS